MEEKYGCCEKPAEEESGESCCCDPAAEEPEEGCCRTRHRTDEEYKDLIHRLNRVEGQIRGIRAMVESDRYCVDILTQVSAAKSALDAFSRELLNQHIHTCVVDQIRGGDDAVVDELCGVIQKLMK